MSNPKPSSTRASLTVTTTQTTELGLDRCTAAGVRMMPPDTFTW
jgi:hypothetical protein